MSNQNIQNREKILQVGIEEFAENGYKLTSTNVICKKANVSKGLLYHHFESKENLYNEVINVVFEDFKKEVNIHKKEKQRGIDYISNYFNSKFKFFSDNQVHHNILVNLLVNPLTEFEKDIAKKFHDYNDQLIYKVLDSIEINHKYEKEKAFELIIMIGEKLEEKHMKGLNKENSHEKLKAFRKDHKLMTEMVFEGIDK